MIILISGIAKKNEDGNNEMPHTLPSFLVMSFDHVNATV